MFKFSSLIYGNEEQNFVSVMSLLARGMRVLAVKHYSEMCLNNLAAI